jgi:hypothetical protein
MYFCYYCFNYFPIYYFTVNLPQTYNLQKQRILRILYTNFSVDFVHKFGTLDQRIVHFAYYAVFRRFLKIAKFSS